MIEYLIFDDEQQCIDVIADVKEIYPEILLDFPVKFEDKNTGDKKYLFVVMEDFRDFILPTYKKDLLVSIPEELEPLDQ